MRHHKGVITFLEKLLERVQLTRHLPPNEVHVFNVHASFGHYQIIIGPASKVLRGNHYRSLEINGALHHLFITRNHVTPHPTPKQIHDNLKGCVIMRDLTLHIKDPTGTGRKLDMSNKEEMVHAREKINLAGNDGDKLIKRLEQTGRLAKDTYRIVQDDILEALTHKQYTSERS